MVFKWVMGILIKEWNLAIKYGLVNEDSMFVVSTIGMHFNIWRMRHFKVMKIRLQVRHLSF